MTTIETTTTTIEPPKDDFVVDDAQLAAGAFLARYSGRTLVAYRHDLRGFFQWAADMQLTVLAATRPHIELFRSWIEDRRDLSLYRTEPMMRRRPPSVLPIRSHSRECGDEAMDGPWLRGSPKAGSRWWRVAPVATVAHSRSGRCVRSRVRADPMARRKVLSEVPVAGEAWSASVGR